MLWLRFGYDLELARMRVVSVPEYGRDAKMLESDELMVQDVDDKRKCKNSRSFHVLIEHSLQHQKSQY